MPSPLPQPIIDQINELIGNRSLPKVQRDSLLNTGANQAWDVLFPEDAGTGTTRLPADRRMQRWNELRTQLSADPNRDNIIRVVESQATGERFDWLD
jgi:hypothetical protein